MDSFFERYGWSYEDFQACPQRLIDILPAVWRTKHDVAERRAAAERAKAKASGKG